MKFGLPNLRLQVQSRCLPPRTEHAFLRQHRSETLMIRLLASHDFLTQMGEPNGQIMVNIPGGKTQHACDKPRRLVFLLLAAVYAGMPSVARGP